MEELSLTHYQSSEWESWVSLTISVPVASLTIQSLILQKEFILDTPLWAGERRGSNQCQALKNSVDDNFSQYS